MYILSYTRKEENQKCLHIKLVSDMLWYLQVASIRSVESSLLTCPMNTSAISGVIVCRNSAIACNEVNVIICMYIHTYAHACCDTRTHTHTRAHTHTHTQNAIAMGLVLLGNKASHDATSVAIYYTVQ